MVACFGCRVLAMLAWGKILYIDDLITKEKCGRSYSRALLDYALM